MEVEKPNSPTMTVLRRNYKRLERHSQLLEMYRTKCGNLLEDIKEKDALISKLSAILDSEEERKRLILGEKFDKIMNEIELLETEQVRLTDSEYVADLDTKEEFELLAATVRDEHIMNCYSDDNVAYVCNKMTDKRWDPICPNCLVRTKAYDPITRTLLVYQENRISIQDDVFYAFKCETCGYTKPNLFYSILRKNPVISDSFVTAEFLSMIIDRKYNRDISFLTQSIMYRSFGVDISYYTLAKWAKEAIDKWLVPIYDALCREIQKSQILYCDNVILRQYDLKAFPDRDGTKYLWVYQTDEKCKKPMVLYEICNSNESCHSAAFLSNFKGTVVCDKFSSYNKLRRSVKIAGSWASLEMMLNEANDYLPSTVKEDAPSGKCLKHIQNLYRIEESVKDFDNDIREEVRKRNSVPLIEEILTTLGKVENDIEESRKNKGPLPDSAVYLFDHKEELMRFVSDGSITIDNVCAKTSLLSFIGLFGRKLVPTGDDFKRVQAVYSLVESARLCGLEVDRYLCYCLINMSNPINEKGISALFPWNAPGECREEFS